MLQIQFGSSTKIYFPVFNSLGVTVGTTGGPPVFVPGGTIANVPFNSLLGRPLIPIEQAQTLGTSGDIILADMSGYLLISKNIEGA